MTTVTKVTEVTTVTTVTKVTTVAKVTTVTTVTTIGTLILATTDYRRLDGRLLGLGRDKGFSPEPPSWL